ncbi:MAG: 30S ribosomal protein S20 [Chloroflexi bacterium]|nr:30S ribosomal protein S20 [Chloroflexota bacterium]
MPAEKTARAQERRRARNRVVRSTTRTEVKKARSLVQSGATEDAETAVRQAQQALDRAARKGIIHPNSAARQKSRLMQRLARAKQTPST